MNDSLLMMNPYRCLRIALVALATIPALGCSGEVERRWSEDVALDDGKVIVVDRHVRFRESNSLAGDAYSSALLAATLSVPGTKPELPAWKDSLVPIVLYRDSSSGEWVAVATTSNCETWNERGRPAPPYWEYRFRNNQWISSTLSEASLGRKSNLFFDFEPGLPNRKISLEVKEQTLARHNFGKKYLRVDPEIRSNCM
jgi:hypothetical protein